MIKQYYIQAIAQLKQSPLISIISIAGTALAIFLIMLVVMVNQIGVMPFTPESNRDRFLHVSFLSIHNKNWGADDSSNGPMSLRSAKELYKSLNTPEAVTAYMVMPTSILASIPGQALLNVDMRETDAEYWKVFDHQFIEGKPYTKQDVDSHIPQAVISETTAKKLFGTCKGVTGKEVLFNYAPCRIAGVVRDVSILASKGYAQVWIPYGTITPNADDAWNDDIMGNFSVTILAKDSKDFPKIRKECDRRLADYSKLISDNGYSIITRDRPYTQQVEALAAGGNEQPDLAKAKRREWIMYVILLLVPAINLASMTHSRLRQRVIEIGVRRAFGSTRVQLFNQIIMENLIITLLAGIVGFIMSILFAHIFASEFFTPGFNPTLVAPQVSFSMIFKPRIFAFAIIFCFVLNILSCGIPAWRASRSNIVNSLDGKID